MTIGFDASRAFIQNPTGTENYSYQLLKALAEIDAEHIVKVYIRPGQESLANKQVWSKNFTFYILHFTFLWTQVGLALRTFTDPLDVLFVPSHTLPLIRRRGLKTVITVHDLGSEYLPGFHQLKQVLYLKLMTYYQLKTATKIIAVSEATKKDLIKKVGISDKKIEVVYEGVDPAFSDQLSDVSNALQRDILKHYGLEKNKYFLFVGTIQPRKNLERLIKSFKGFLETFQDTGLLSSDKIYDLRLKIKDSKTKSHQSSINLVLVGSKGWKSHDIYKLPKELGIEKQVKFLGRVSDEQLAVLYSNAAALTYPSLFEGFGLPILEAFSCGCPVITSNTSSMPEVAGDGAILVNPKNETEISEAMTKIVKDDKLRYSLIQKGYSRLKDFSWEKCAKETLVVLNQARKT